MLKRNEYAPKGKPRLLMRALLQMTMETEDATDKKSAPMTPNWKFEISPISDQMIETNNQSRIRSCYRFIQQVFMAAKFRFLQEDWKLEGECRIVVAYIFGGGMKGWCLPFKERVYLDFKNEDSTKLN